MKTILKPIMLGILGLMATSAFNAHCMNYSAFQAMQSSFMTLWRHTNACKQALRHQTDAYRAELADSSTDNYLAKSLDLLIFRAKHLYDFQSQYPLEIDFRRPIIPASASIKIAQHNGELYADDKIITLHSRWIPRTSYDQLTYLLMHEHEHLFKDHTLHEIKLAQALKANKSVTFNNVTISPEEFSKDKAIISRLCEQEADAAVQNHAPLCRAAAQFFMNRLQSIPVNSYGHKISLLNDPEEIKKHEHSHSHPHDKRRLLYFKKWIEDAENGSENNV